MRSKLKEKGFLLGFFISLMLVLTACGGGGSADNSDTKATTSGTKQPEMESIAGGFQSTSKRVFNDKSTIQSVINSIDIKGITAKYPVSSYKIEYMTRDTSNALVKVSGIIAVPTKSSASPIISFQHGTLYLNKDAPSFHLKPSAKSPEVALASQGYVVIAADYVGYGTSSGQKHPYLQQQASADVVIDLLKASKKWLDFNNVKTTQQLFMTGYSQGGYVTMAALKALQESPGNLSELDLEVAGAVMGAGPYDLHAALTKLTFGIPLSGALADLAIDRIEQAMLNSRADVEFERDFLERFFANDRQDDVHNWKPDIPIKLFHGKDDRTVPIEAAESTLRTMKNLQADIELISCTAVPADHTHCVYPYVDYMLKYFEKLVTYSRKRFISDASISPNLARHL